MTNTLREVETLFEVASDAAAQNATRPFLTHLSSGQTVTYGEIASVAAGLLRLLGESGVKPGDRVALVATNHWIFFPLLAACGARGCVLAPVNPDLHPDEIKFILGDAAPRVVVTDGAMPHVQAPNAMTMTIDDALAKAGDRPPARPEPSDPSSAVLMVYTSGTTGGGKGVMLSQRNLLSMGRILVSNYEVTESDRIYGVLPLHHMNGIMLTGLVPLIAGAQVFLADVFSFKNAKFYWSHLAELGITILSLVPSIMAVLLRIFPDGPKTAIDTVRFGFCGTAPLRADVWRSFEERCGFRIYQGYGLTETTTWATCTRPDMDHTYETVGVPVGCEVRIAPARGLADGEGEVLIRGPMVMVGYHRKARLTREQFDGDFLRTGDLGYFDDQGELRISGRKKDIIIKNGININPIEIDAVVLQHPEVLECKTIGLPDDIAGEIIECVLVARDPARPPDTGEIKRWVHDKMSPFYCPDRVTTVGCLPKGPTGKVAQKALAQILSGEMAAQILKKLTMWKYRRARPSDPEAIERIVQHALVQASPIPLLMYWGCGARDELAEIDRTTLDRLVTYLRGAAVVESAAPELTLLLNDMHSEINEIPKERQRRYYGAVAKYAESVGMEPVWQSEVWRAQGLDLADIVHAAKAPTFDDQWASLSIREQLVAQAGKHCQNSDAETGARVYLMACMREASAVSAQYPGHLFLTYNGPDFDVCLPDLPKLYVYSYKKGRTEKPWFL